MKFAFAILLVACALPSVLLSQTPENNKQLPGKSAHDRPHDIMPRDKFLENLSPEVRERFEAAREKAMQDPKVEELKLKAEMANKELRAAVREAMMKADPSLADIIKQNAGNRNKPGKEGEPPGEPRPRFSQLSESDRQKLTTATKAAKADPAVQAAEEKKKAASTPEEQHSAAEEFHKAMREAILQADPSLEPILEQLRGQKGPPHENQPNPPNPEGEQN